MNSNVEFLKSRLAEVKKRIAASNDYKEMKVLERMIGEMEPTESRSMDAAAFYNQLTQPFGTGPRLGKSSQSTKEGYNRDTNNSPVPHISYRERTTYVYNIVEKLVKENNGEMDIEELTEILKEKHDIAWPEGKSSKLAGYIDLYNRTHIDDQRLGLWPERKPGQLRINKYLKVLYKGKERLSNAV